MSDFLSLRGGVLWAHGLHLLFSPVCPVYNVLIGYPRFPETACLRSVAGSHDRSSLIFSGFQNSVVSWLAAKGGVLSAFAWHVCYIGNLRKRLFQKISVCSSFAWGLSGVFTGSHEEIAEQEGS